VLISGGKMTKALQLARSFHSAGHRVVFCETHKYWLSGHRFSRSVNKFNTTPEPTADDYVSSLLSIIQAEKVDAYVPVCSPLSSYFDSHAMRCLSEHCEVMHTDRSQIELLDDKYRFACAAHSLELGAPRSVLITDVEQVLAFDFEGESRKYILKSIAYDSVRRLDLTKLPFGSREDMREFLLGLPISQDNPWVMQEFIPGKEYCTHSTVKNGELRLHCCCESSAFQVNYQSINDPEIEGWVRRFAERFKLTGQISFDFIRANDDGRLYAIECNPRTHSAITTFHDNIRVAEAYLGAESLEGTVTPRLGSKPTFWIYHEIWRLICGLHSLRKIGRRIKVVLSGKDAIFDWRDPLPFLIVHHVQIPLLLLCDLYQLRGWVRIDFNIGKLVQLGGD